MGLARDVLRNVLPQSAIERLRLLRPHVSQTARLLFDKDASVVPQSPISFGETWNLVEKGQQAYRSGGPELRTAIKKRLMLRAVLDPHLRDIVSDDYFQRVCGDNDLVQALRGASLYGNGRPAEAAVQFALAFEKQTDVLNSYVLGRCYGVGVGDQRAAIAVFGPAVERYPDDVQLRLALASAFYRTGSVTKANETVSQGGQAVQELYKSARNEALRTVAPLEHASKTGLAEGTPGTEKGYGEDSVQPYWEQLWFHMLAANPYQHGWAGLTDVFQSRLAGTLRRFPQIKKVVNFGVFCAHADFHLALKFPEVEFIGVDLQQRVKDLNDAAFSAPNLAFHAGNIFELLPKFVQPGDSALLFHARTATLCYPELVRQVYRAAAGTGVEFIALWENDSLARSSLTYYELAEFPEVPVLYAPGQLIHNYSSYLAHAGYSVVTHERAPSNRVLFEDAEGEPDGHTYMVGQAR